MKTIQHSKLPVLKKKRSDQEHELQCAAVLWFRYQYAKYKKLLFAIPNGGSRSKKTFINKAGQKVTYSPEAKRMIEEGLLPGVSDLFLSVPRGKYHGLYLETKWGKNKLSPDQQEFIQEVKSQDYKVVVFRTLDQFMTEVNNYMNLN